MSKSWFQRAQAFFGAPEEESHHAARDYAIDARLMAFLVGVAALFLPLFLMLGSAWLGDCRFQSISHYYYSPWLGPVLVGTLFFIGSFLIAYRGMTRRENRLATCAGLGAFGVALFPASDPGCDAPAFRARAFVDYGASSPLDPARAHELAPWADIAHYLSAGVVFSILTVFCLFIFTRIIRDQHRVKGGLRRAKRVRNAIYIVCGGMMAAILALFVARFVGVFDVEAWNARNMTFRLEAAMLMLFGLSWFVKGRMGPIGPLLGDWLLDPADQAQARGK